MSNAQDASFSAVAPERLDLNRYREYLQSRAKMDLRGRFAGKVDASDIVQECLLDAQKALPAFRGEREEQILAWLRTILEHRLTNRYRHYLTRKRDVRREVPMVRDREGSALLLDKLLAADQTSPSGALRQFEETQRLRLALDQLPPEQRQAVMLKHLEGRSLVEVATEMQRSLTATGGLLKRGMQRLRQIMAKSNAAHCLSDSRRDC